MSSYRQARLEDDFPEKQRSRIIAVVVVFIQVNLELTDLERHQMHLQWLVCLGQAQMAFNPLSSVDGDAFLKEGPFPSPSSPTGAPVCLARLI